jgi:uncharacterized membrane protein YkgB
MEQLPLFVLLLYALYEGLLHAFEADHILAVTTIVSQRNRLRLALGDGLFWGLGHTSTIFLVGILMILCRVHIPEHAFSWFEAAVGAMLVIVASYRICLFLHDERHSHTHSREHAGANRQPHVHLHFKGRHLHRTSYGIGIVHGLAGSGALVVLVMTQIGSVTGSLLYLLIFGAGSVGGMMLVAGLFSIPFSGKFVRARVLRTALVLLSSALCLAYGCYVMYASLF